MNVVLKSSGCNVLKDKDTYENITPTTKETYVIYEGVAHLTKVETGSFSYTGECLETGDLVFQPQTDVYFQALSVFFVGIILYFLYKITIGRFIK